MSDELPNHHEILRNQVVVTPVVAAEIYGCSVELIYKRARSGDLESYRISEKRIAIPTAAIRAELGLNQGEKK